MNHTCIIMNMSGIYEKIQENQMKYMITEQEQWIDCTEIRGTDCYCDEEAEYAIKKKISDISYEGIHFIDSGNYHYISKLWMEKIDKAFTLIVLDHHPDMQPLLLGDILSCGSWVKNVLDSNKLVNQVISIGVNQDLLSEVPTEYLDRVTVYTKQALENVKVRNSLMEQIIHVTKEQPVYLSIDKDVLRVEEVKTNWDQGTMTYEYFSMIVSTIMSNSCEVLGIDICGEQMPSLDVDINDLVRSNFINQEITTMIL